MRGASRVLQVLAGLGSLRDRQPQLRRHTPQLQLLVGLRVRVPLVDGHPRRPPPQRLPGCPEEQLPCSRLLEDRLPARGRLQGLPAASPPGNGRKASYRAPEVALPQAHGSQGNETLTTCVNTGMDAKQYLTLLI